eukprot:TRINITY_DN63889_c0_g1_i1.p1 TRINITY_DN63889_c0_g1~~TRINITY_DN63889_c0_g1_i1.p1  ORF type:complete len:239 (-),score=2.22 TRINITY_DN63889_c0_g1_i1:264-980(-)
MWTSCGGLWVILALRPEISISANWVRSVSYAAGTTNCAGLIEGETWHLQEKCQKENSSTQRHRKWVYNSTSDRMMSQIFESGADCLEDTNVVSTIDYMLGQCQSNIMYQHNISWDAYLMTDEYSDNECETLTGSADVVILNKCVQTSSTTSWRYSSNRDGVSHYTYATRNCTGSGTCQFTHQRGCPMGVVVGCNRDGIVFHKNAVHGAESRYRVSKGALGAHAELQAVALLALTLTFI